MSGKPVRRDLALLVAILLVAAFLRIWGIGFGLPFTYHPDEHQYVDSALGFLSGDLNPHRFNNPALFKVALGAIYALWAGLGIITGAWHSVADFQAMAIADPTPFYLLGRLASGLFGVATVGLTWLLGRRAGLRWTAWLASTAMAVAFLHVRDSHYAVNDVPAAFFSTAALLFGLRVLQCGATRDYLLAGACIGLAGATKYTGLLAALSLVLAHVLRPATSRELQTAHGNPRSAVDRLSSIFDRRLWAAGGAAVMAYLVAAPYTVLDWPTFIEDVGILSARGASGFKGLQIDAAPGWLFYLKVLDWGLGLPLLLASLAGLGVALWRQRPPDLVLVAFPLALYIYLGSQLLMFGRFIIPALPVLAILAAEALEAAVDRLAVSETRRRMLVATGAVVLLALPLAASLRSDLLLTREDTRTLAKTWIEANIPAGTRLVTQSNGPELSGNDVAAPRSQRSYDLTVVGTTSLEQKPLGDYRQQGFDYLIVSSFSSDRVLLDPDRQAQRRAFYERLASDADRVQEFRPYAGEAKPPFVFDQIYGPANDLWRFIRPGPVIQVYKLR